MELVLTLSNLHYRWFWVINWVLADGAKLFLGISGEIILVLRLVILRKDVDAHLYDIFELLLLDLLLADHRTIVVKMSYYWWSTAVSILQSYRFEIWVFDDLLWLCLDLFLVIDVERNNFYVIIIIISIARYPWWTTMTRYSLSRRIGCSTKPQSLIPLRFLNQARLLNPRTRRSSDVFLLTQAVVNYGYY